MRQTLSLRFLALSAFFVTKTRASKFTDSFLPLSTFFPAGNRVAEIFAPFLGVTSFFCYENTPFEISRLFSCRYQLFPPGEIVRRKFSTTLRAYSAFFVTKTCASKFIASFPLLPTFFTTKYRAAENFAPFSGLLFFYVTKTDVCGFIPLHSDRISVF